MYFNIEFNGYVKLESLYKVHRASSLDDGIVLERRLERGDRAFRRALI